MTIDQTLDRIGASLSAGTGCDGMDVVRALTASLHAVRGQLPPEAAALYRYKLPEGVRGIYLENWSGRRSTQGKYALLCEVEGHFKDEGIDPEAVTRSVFRALREVKPDVLDPLRPFLPEDVWLVVSDARQA